jgi:hypothetical protein
MSELGVLRGKRYHILQLEKIPKKHLNENNEHEWFGQV